MPFMNMMGIDDALTFLNSPDDSEYDALVKFVQSMAGVNQPDADDESTASELLVQKVYDQTASKDKFVKQYIIRTMKDIPGVQKDVGTIQKPSTVENFKTAIDEYPYLFRFNGLTF